MKRIGELYRIEAELRGLDPEARLAARRERTAPLITDMETWLTHHRSRVAAKSPLGEALKYIAKYWVGLCMFLTDGRIEIDNNTVERTIRPIAKRVSLCTPYSSVCKHWKCIRVNVATRATFPGYGSFDRFRRQVVGTDLIRRAGHHLHSRKDAGFDKAPYRVVCDAG